MNKLKSSALFLALIAVFILTSCNKAPNKTDSGEKTRAGGNYVQSPFPDSKAVLPADGPIYELSLADSSTDDETYQTYVEFAKKLNEQSGGKIKVVLFHGGKLGSDSEIMEGVQEGNISLAVCSTSAQIAFIPEVAVFDMPGIFDSFEQSGKVYNGKFKKLINVCYNKAGLELISLNSTDFRKMSSNVKIQSFEDFKGIRVRTLDNKYHIDFWRSLGANPFALPFADLYIALQQNMVQAQQSLINVVVSSRLYEVQKYIVEIDFLMNPRALVMNKKLYDSMPADYQKLIVKLADERTQLTEAMYMEKQAKHKKFLADYGMEFIELSDEVKIRIKKASQPIKDSIRKDVGDDLVNALLSEIEAARN